MLAYHNDPKLKQDILEQLYTPDYKIPMEEYETRFGIPEVLVYLQRAIFEELSPVVTKQLHINFMSAIPVGADLSGIWREFAVWLLIDPIDGVIQYTNPGTDAHNAIIKVANLYQHGYTTQQMQDAAYDAAIVANAASANAASANASVAYTANAAATASAAANAVAYAAFSFVAAKQAITTAVYSIFAVYAKDDGYAAYSAVYTNFDANMKMSAKLIHLLQNMDKTRIENAGLS